MSAARSEQPLVGAPPDHCPYSRPFPAGFDKCPAYQPLPYIGLDTHQQPLPPVWTCRHLTVGEDKASGGHYPRCRVGDGAARLAWVEKLSCRRVEQMRRLRTDFGEFSRPYMQAIWAARGRQMKHNDAELSGALKRVSEEYLRAADAYLREHSALLEELGIPTEVAREMLSLAMTQWNGSTAAAATFDVPERILNRLPEHGRLFVKPESA